MSDVLGGGAAAFFARRPIPENAEAARRHLAALEAQAARQVWGYTLNRSRGSA